LYFTRREILVFLRDEKFLYFTRRVILVLIFMRQEILVFLRDEKFLYFARREILVFYETRRKQSLLDSCIRWKSEILLNFDNTKKCTKKEPILKQVILCSFTESQWVEWEENVFFNSLYIVSN
jgi:hypothetical protein